MTPTRARVDAAGLEVLDTDECRRLLEAGGVGRVALPGEPPIVRPVNYVLDGGRIVMRTAAGCVWRAAVDSQLVTFEVDSTSNVDHRGWSVIASGPITTVERDDQVLALPLRAWAPRGRDRFVAIMISELSGRRLW